MKVALVGVTGRVGSRLLAELLRRGHQVTGIARDVSKVVGQPKLVLKSADANQPAQLVPLLKGHDAVLSALKFAPIDAATLIAAVKRAAVGRFLVVGVASRRPRPGVAASRRRRRGTRTGACPSSRHRG